MIRSTKRFFSFSPAEMLRRTSAKASQVLSPQPATLDDIKVRMLAAFNDCDSPTAARIRYSVMKCITATELWLTRSDIFQVVSSHHGQKLATERVNQLLPLFRGWLPKAQLTRLR